MTDEQFTALTKRLDAIIELLTPKALKISGPIITGPDLTRLDFDSAKNEAVNLMDAPTPPRTSG